MITGGASDRLDSELISVEVLSSSGVPIPCTVPPLPAYTDDHTQDGVVACGGHLTNTSCSTLTASGWTTSHQLQQRRSGHVSWTSPAGLLLMGGEYWYSNSRRTTELLTDTGSSSPSYDLEYDTW